MNLKKKYLSSAFLMLGTTIFVKLIGAVYKIPLTAFIGGVGRGYFAYAYNLCMPVHAITMGVFPITLSKLVSKYNSLSNNDRVNSLFKASTRLFALVGFLGMLLLIAFAKPYSVYIAHSPRSIFTILVLAPSVLFSCMSASYRGYYEGFMNMLPTSVSQTIEATFKLIFGLLFAKYSMAYLYNAYVNTGYVLCNKALNEKEALSLIYPLTSACAMLGVTLGTMLSVLFLQIYRKINTPKIKVNNQLVKSAKKEILLFSFPIMVSTSVQSVFQFLDTASIQLALNHIDPSFLKEVYNDALSLVTVSNCDVPTYLFGIFSASLDFKNLVPGVTMALGVCAVPAISRAFESDSENELNSITNSIFKYTSLLAIMGGVAIALCSKEILSVFYGNSSKDIVVGATDLVKYFALSVPVYSLAGISVFTCQAIGIADKTILPFFISGVVRVLLNYILVKYTSLVLLGAVISGAVGYLVLLVWTMVLISQKSSVRFSLFDIVLKPSLVASNALIIGFFNEKFRICLSNLYFNLLFKLSIFVLFYLILCFCFGILDIKAISALKNKKKMA